MYMAAQQGEWETIEKMVKSLRCLPTPQGFLRTYNLSTFNLTLGGGANLFGAMPYRPMLSFIWASLK